MKITEIERGLREIAAGQEEDPQLTEAKQLSADLRTRVTALKQQITERGAALRQAELDAETSLLAGKGFDDRALNKLQAEISNLAVRLDVHDRALAVATGRVEDLERARAVRIEGALRPMFVDLLAQQEAQVSALAETERVLAHAHHVASNAMVGMNSPLLHGGYAIFAPEMKVTWWRDRARRAGLLAVDRRIA